MKTYKINEIEIPESELRRLISENPELIEKKEEKKKSFYPGDGEEYYLIREFGDIKTYNYQGLDSEKAYFYTNNAFKTEEEAQKELKKRKALARMRKYVIENNMESEPDWTDPFSKKYYIYITFDSLLKKWNICTSISFTAPENELPVFDCWENADKFREDNRQNIFDYFGIGIRDEN